MLNKRYILSLIGLLLVVASICNEFHLLILEDIDNIEKRELEEKLKEQLKSKKNQLSALGFDLGNDHVDSLPSTQPIFGFSLLDNTNNGSKHLYNQQSVKPPLFILYCCFKTHCS